MGMKIEFAWPISCETKIIRSSVARVTFRALAASWMFSRVFHLVIFPLITRVWFQIFLTATWTSLLFPFFVVGEIQRFACFVQSRFWEGRSHFYPLIQGTCFREHSGTLFAFRFEKVYEAKTEDWGIWIPTFVIWLIGCIILIFSRFLVSFN